MGDISTRGKGKALKMKKGGALPSNKGASKAGMQRKQGRNFLLPKEPKPKRGRDPERPPKFQPRPRPMPRDPKKVPEFRPLPKRDPKAIPMPMPMPRPEREKYGIPMPDRRPKLPKDLEKYFMKTPRRATPLMKKDGGEMKNLAKMFSKSTTSSMGVSAGTLKKAFEQAKKMKPTGRLNMDDLKKALGMMGAAKKTQPKIKGRLGGPKTSSERRTKLRKLI